MHFVSSSLEFETFQHLFCPIVSVNFNITKLHFVLFQYVTSYTTSLLSHIHIDTTKRCNVTCTLVIIGVILLSLDCILCSPYETMYISQSHTLELGEARRIRPRTPLRNMYLSLSEAHRNSVLDRLDNVPLNTCKGSF